MTNKKNLPPGYTPDEQIWHEAKKTVIGALITASFTLMGFGVVTYFTVLSLSSRVDALESDSVHKDSIFSIEKRLDRMEAKLDRIIEQR